MKVQMIQFPGVPGRSDETKTLIRVLEQRQQTTPTRNKDKTLIREQRSEDKEALQPRQTKPCQGPARRRNQSTKEKGRF